MKNKELKVIWKLAKSFWIAGFLLWAVETIVFLIIEGWHYKATNPTEIWLDGAVSTMWEFALNLTVVVCVYSLMNLAKNNKVKK